MFTERLPPTPAGIARAAHLLRSGGTVAFPTETVYGLGANALNPHAVAQVFAAKQRPSWDPLIVHIADFVQLPALAQSSPLVQKLTDVFWPGPLTLLLPRTSLIPDAVTAGRPLVGLRVPAHPTALDLLRQTNLPIAAPSANRFGHTSPTTAQHVLHDLDTRINAVLDAGATSVGLESTVFDPATLTIYRPGAITATMLETITGPNTIQIFTPQPTPNQSALPSPGTSLRHYAPRAPLILIRSMEEFDSHQSPKPGILLPAGWPVPSHLLRYTWGPWDDHATLARNLFAGLRALDDAGATLIFCPIPQGSGLAAAIRNRLERATRPPEPGTA